MTINNNQTNILINSKRTQKKIIINHLFKEKVRVILFKKVIIIILSQRKMLIKIYKVNHKEFQIRMKYHNKKAN